MPDPISSYEFHSNGTFLVDGQPFPWLIAREVIASPEGITITLVRDANPDEGEVEIALETARDRLRRRAGRA